MPQKEGSHAKAPGCATTQYNFLIIINAYSLRLGVKKTKPFLE